MNLYKVTFSNNIAVSANQIDCFNGKNVKVEKQNGKRLLLWLTVYANDKTKSIDAANEIVKDYFKFL